MHGPLRLTYTLLANYMAKCQMSSGPYGPIFIFFYIYIVNRVSSSGKGKKMDSSMMWTKSILMPSKVRLKNVKECSRVK